MMGGKIVVQSIYGKGSKFTIAIDQRVVHKNKDDILDSTQALNIDDLKTAGKKVLIVDDNRINLKVAGKLLRELNLRTEEVISGELCLEKVKNGEKYDIIFHGYNDAWY